MKKLFAAMMIVSMLMVAALSFASGDMTWTPQTNFHGVNQAPAQFFAPQGDQNTALTVASTTVDLTNYIMFAVTTGSSGTCYYRTMASSTKAGTAVPLPVSSVHIRARNPATPFVNLSGCTGGYLQKQ